MSDSAVQLMRSVQRLDRVRPQLEALIRPAFSLRLEPVADPIVGASRIGGRPDFPKGLKWPDVDGEPLAFICQIRLPVSEVDTSRGLLPTRGMLYFFYDQTQEAWGGAHFDFGNWKVLYDEAEDLPLRQARWPTGLDVSARFKAHTLRVSPVDSIPDGSSHLLDSLSLTEDEHAAYVAVRQRLRGDSGHQFLGYPDIIQGDMQTELDVALLPLAKSRDRRPYVSITS